MKDNSYQTIFPNCAKYLSPRKLAERPLLGSSLARAETSAKREEAKRLYDIELKTVRSIEDVSYKMKDPSFAVCTAHLTYKTELSQITFTN